MISNHSLSRISRNWDGGQDVGTPVHESQYAWLVHCIQFQYTDMSHLLCVCVCVCGGGGQTSGCYIEAVLQTGPNSNS